MNCFCISSGLTFLLYEGYLHVFSPISLTTSLINILGSGEDENTHRAKVNSDIKDIIGKYTRQELCIEEEEDSLIKKPCLLPEAKPKVFFFYEMRIFF